MHATVCKDTGGRALCWPGSNGPLEGKSGLALQLVPQALRVHVCHVRDQTLGTREETDHNPNDQGAVTSLDKQLGLGGADASLGQKRGNHHKGQGLLRAPDVQHTC